MNEHHHSIPPTSDPASATDVSAVDHVLRQDADRLQRRFEPSARAWAEFRARTEDGAVDTRHVKPASTRLHREWSGVRRGHSWIAQLSYAGLAIAVIALLAFGVNHRFGDASLPAAPARYQTAPGEQSTIRLADGSVVTLGPATTLSIAHGELTLVGEALFKVRGHVTRPFVVNTANARVQVLGTTFMVRRYQTDASSRIVVADGKVDVRSLAPRQSSKHAGVPVVLSANMMGEISDTNVVVRDNVSARDRLAWAQGRLVFDETPLGDVLAELQRVYGADVRVSDSVLARAPVTLTIRVDDDALEQVMDLVATAVDAHYSRVNAQQFVLQPGRRTPPAARRTVFPKPEPQYGR